MPPEDDDLRSAIEESIEKIESGEVPSSDEPGTPLTADEAPAPPAEPKPPEGEAPAPPAEPKPPEGEAKPPAEAAKPAEAPPPGDQDPVAKPPGTWTPAAREHWAALPPAIKQEVWKREREASRALTVSAQARQAQAEFERTMQPYLGFIAAEKSTPLQAVNYMMQTAAGLRVGTPQQKVQIVADVIKQYGIDLEALDSVLAGQQPRFDPNTLIQTEVQRAIAPLLQERQQAQQFQAQRAEQQIEQELEAFVNDPKHEFYADVRDVMADLMELAGQRGQQMGLTEAYERAILIHEPVRRVIEGRRQAEQAQEAANKAKQARRAAASIPESSDIRSGAATPGDSVRSAIEFAIANTEGR